MRYTKDPEPLNSTPTDTVAKQVKHSKTQGIQFADLMKTVWRQGANIIQLENRIISLTAQGITSS